MKPTFKKSVYKNPVMVEAIQRAGGTQDLLAKRSGVSQPRLSILLRQEKLGLRTSTARALAKATGMDVTRFL